MRRFPIAVAALLTVGSAVMARPQTPQLPSEPSSVPSFHTATIKSTETGLIDVRFLPNRFEARTVTLVELIVQAYDLASRDVVGGPEWVRADRFTVSATTASNVGPDQMKQMLQTLLADRFQLQLASEAQASPTYRLTAGNIRNLKRSDKPNKRSEVVISHGDDDLDKDFYYRGVNATMGDLTQVLAQHLNAPVADDTRLAGRFDFKIALRFTDHVQPEPNVSALRVALENQLGLTLVAGEGARDVVAIRRVSKPSAN